MHAPPTETDFTQSVTKDKDVKSITQSRNTPAIITEHQRQTYFISKTAKSSDAKKGGHMVRPRDRASSESLQVHSHKEWLNSFVVVQVSLNTALHPPPAHCLPAAAATREM